MVSAHIRAAGAARASTRSASYGTRCSGSAAAMKMDATNADQIAEYERNNIKPLIYRYLPNYKLICTSPIRTVADLEGKKIRTFGSYVPKMFAAMKATPVNVLPTDMYQSLKRGSMDCSYLTNAFFVTYKLYEVAKYVIEVDFGAINAYLLAINRGRWNALPDNVRNLMLEVGAEATEFGVHQTREVEEASLDQVVAAGAEIVVFEEQDALEAAAPDMIALWIAEAAKIGKEAEARAYVAQLKDLLGMN